MEQLTTAFLFVTFSELWSIIGWGVAAVVAIVYVFSGTLQNLASGRKELLDVSDKKLENVKKERDEAVFMVHELEKRIEKLEKEKAEIERDKTLLMREHHQLLEISVSDLQTLKENTKKIEELEEELRRYRP